MKEGGGDGGEERYKEGDDKRLKEERKEGTEGKPITLCLT